MQKLAQKQDLKIRPDADRLASRLAKMIAISSINPFDEVPVSGFREQEFADHWHAMLQAKGFEINQHEVAPDRPNVWGIRKGKGTGPSIMLAAHMDTVGIEGYESALIPHIADGRVYGRGACDMKAAFACYLEVVEMLDTLEIELEGDLILAGICDEEHVQIGSAHFGKYGPKADFGIIGEPTDLAICPAHKGQLGVYIRTFGRAVHSSVPESGINAVEHMGHVLQALAGYRAEIAGREPHALCGHGRMSANVIRGGQFVSGVPDQCELEVDRRYLPDENIDEVIADYHRHLAPLSVQVPGFHYEISDPSLDVRPLNVPINSEIVIALQEAVQDVTNAPAAIRAFPGGTDASNLSFPCVICGPGELQQAHSINEYVEIDQMVSASLIYLKTILSLNGLNGGA